MALKDETAKKLQRIATRLARDHAKRDELIRQAKAEGGGVREIAREAGLTHPAVIDILQRDSAASV